ncbi:MAG TPA: cell division protein FtsA [Candidatus Paceibacterota bacterium]|jgi:cell division protein FtsA|nr:cell division protein FtsA [Candidatus Paceibacterota bacterium]
MIRNVSVGIDVGSAAVRVVVGEFLKGEKDPKIIGTGEAPAEGLRHGYVTDAGQAAQCVRAALRNAEKSSGIKIRRAFVSVGGVTVRGESQSGEAVISKADGEVTALDINKALEDCEENLSLGNKKIIGIFPTSFKLDGKEVLGRPEGMRGTKLEAKALFVTTSDQHLEELLSVVAEAGVEPVDIVAGPVAASAVALSEKEKIVGSALVNIGAETTSLAVFENGTLISLYTFSIGSSDITNDIALGFKITLEEAERMKLGEDQSQFSKKKFEEIVEARLADIFELIGNHLKKIKRNELLPAGIVFVGGGARTPGLEELSKSSLKLPSKIGTTEMFGQNKTRVRDSSWFTAVGLLYSDSSGSGYASSSSSSLFKGLKNTIKSITKQLMP